MNEKQHPTLTFSRFQKLNAERCKLFHPLEDWTPLEYGGALAGEVGELCNMLKKLRRGDVVLREDMGRELGDCAAYLALVAARLDLDLGYWAALKFNEFSAKKGVNFQIQMPGPTCGCGHALHLHTKSGLHLRWLPLQHTCGVAVSREQRIRLTVWSILRQRMPKIWICG